MRNCDDFPGSFSSVFNGEVIGKAMVNSGHFTARVEVENKVVNGENVGPSVEDGHVKMREIGETKFGLI